MDQIDFIEAIHSSPQQLMLVTAGAGTNALAQLLSVAGASQTLLESLIPYSKQSFSQFLGHTPYKHVHARTAKLLAGTAYRRARELAEPDVPVLGVACTATVATTRPKQGDHRAHIAIWQPTQLIAYHFVLAKGARTRDEEETAVSDLLLHAIATSMGLPSQLPKLFAEDELTHEQFDFAQMAQQLHMGARNYFGIHAHGVIRTESAKPQVVLSGSFNPLHEGHLGLAQAVSQYLGKPVAFELTAVNADKPSLTPEQTIQRMAQFAGLYPVYASNAPTFVEKARLYGETVFVIGYDTAIRVLSPRFYGHDPAKMAQALHELHTLGARFLVAGRVDGNGRFLSAHELQPPPDFAHLFEPLPEFRIDISSTEIRRQRATSAYMLF